MTHSSRSPSPRAWAIAAGLVRTRRATKYDVTDGYIRAEGRAQRYWITDNGARVLRGKIIATADVLQDGFVDAMARAGKDH